MILSGCMEELRTGQAPVSAPSARPQATQQRPPAAAPATRQPAPGSMAPDPATAAPSTTAVTAATTAATTTTTAATARPAATSLPPLTLPTTATRSNEERWREQQQDRQVFDGLLGFATTGSELWWFDPVNQQHVILGRLTGDFVAQAQFQLRGQGVQALEVPYQVNVSYGLTALSPSLVGRIAAAGYASDWIETYVFLSPDVTPR